MSQEQRRKTKGYVLLSAGVLICAAGFFVSGWVCSAGLIMALLSIQPLVAVELPVPPSVEEGRGRKRQVQPRCKKLAIKELTFRANLHPLFLLFFFLLFGCFGACLLYSAAHSHEPIFIAVCATVSFLAFALLFFTYQTLQSHNFNFCQPVKLSTRFSANILRGSLLLDMRRNSRYQAVENEVP